MPKSYWLPKEERGVKAQTREIRELREEVEAWKDEASTQQLQATLDENTRMLGYVTSGGLRAALEAQSAEIRSEIEKRS